MIRELEELCRTSETGFAAAARNPDFATALYRHAKGDYHNASVFSRRVRGGV